MYTPESVEYQIYFAQVQRACTDYITEGKRRAKVYLRQKKEHDRKKKQLEIENKRQYKALLNKLLAVFIVSFIISLLCSCSSQGHCRPSFMVGYGKGRG